VITADANLIYCIAAAWLIEFTLGASRAFVLPASVVRRILAAAADKFLTEGSRTDKRAARSGMMPARYEGRAASAASADARQCARERRAGLFFALYCLVFTLIFFAVALDAARRLNAALYYILNALVISGALGARRTAGYAAAALKPPRGGGPAAPAENVIVNISRNCLEGVFAPLLFVAAGVPLGLPAAFAALYNMLAAVCAMFENGATKYGDSGRAALTIKRVADFMPARLCAVILPLFAPACGSGLGGVARGFGATRDAHSARIHGNMQPDLNRALVAAAFAGTLGIDLRNASEDFASGFAGGKLSAGEHARPGARDVKRAAMLTVIASFGVTAAGTALALIV